MSKKAWFKGILKLFLKLLRQIEGLAFKMQKKCLNFANFAFLVLIFPCVSIC